jgi:GAF domain-containing protein
MADDTAPMQPQDAFEELARVTLAEHSLGTVMDKVAVLAKRTLPGADEVSVTMVDRGTASTVAFTGQLAAELDERQYERGYGPCLESVREDRPIRVDSMRTEPRWRDWSALASRHGAASSLSVPVPLQRDVSAALNIYSTVEHAFDDHSVELALTFAGFAAVALANIHLYEVKTRVAEQLQTAMRSRAVIEQAKGIIMADRRCSAQEAFDVLVGLSQTSNRKLRDLAQALVEQTDSTRTG